jgi:hypothetical protein
MTLLSNLSIRGKLLAGFGAVLALTAVLGVVMLSQIGAVNNGADRIGTNSLPSVRQIDQAALDASSARSMLGESIIQTDAAKVTADLVVLKSYLAQTSKLLSTYGPLASPGQDTVL